MNQMIPVSPEFCCPTCRKPLLKSPEMDFYSCPTCAKSWPIISGVPRFFQQTEYYWGEVERQSVAAMLAAATEGSWVDAAKEFLPKRLWNYVFDPYRAAWLPLVGIGPDAVVLDIGSGYGGITHALSHAAGIVYSLEAVAERIEFTKIRLEQAGVRNVHLVQGSALELPFAPKTFDLIVVNGVLEWIGDWDQRSTPRAAQLGFLSHLRELLSDNGVILIGIENRFGFGLFQGGMDHSSMPYTSLMPRWLASWAMRKRKQTQYRLTVQSKLEYRTYTYSARGYRKLLREAGFPVVDSYWVDPGYNHPIALISLRDKGLMASWYKKIFSASRGWKRQIKIRAADIGLFNWMVPSFVFVGKQAVRESPQQQWFAQQFVKHLGTSPVVPGEIEFSALTGGSKSVLRFIRPREVAKNFLAKSDCHTGALTGEVKQEYESLVAVRRQIDNTPGSKISVPEPLGSVFINGTFLSLERFAQGRYLPDSVKRPGYFRALDDVEKDFSRILSSCKELAEILAKTPSASIEPSWLKIPQQIEHDRDVSGKLQQMRLVSSIKMPTWTQHGDFAVENIFLNDATEEVTIIDWAHLASGLPPLYDAFSFLSSIYYVDESKHDVGKMTEQEFRNQSFLDKYVFDNPVSRLFARCMVNLCKDTGIDPNSIPALHIEYLIIRANFFATKSETQAVISLGLLKLAVEHRSAPILGISRTMALRTEPATVSGK